jgi:hypothetical protein
VDGILVPSAQTWLAPQISVAVTTKPSGHILVAKVGGSSEGGGGGQMSVCGIHVPLAQSWVASCGATVSESAAIPFAMVQDGKLARPVKARTRAAPARIVLWSMNRDESNIVEHP